MSTPNLETELINARAAFNAVENTSGHNLQALGGLYCALLDEYLDKLRRPQASTISLSPYAVQSGRHWGQAAQLDYKSMIEWAEAEKIRALRALGSGKKKASVKK